MKHSQRRRGTSNTHHIIRISSFFYNAGMINFPSQRATWWRWVRKTGVRYPISVTVIGSEAHTSKEAEGGFKHLRR